MKNPVYRSHLLAAAFLLAGWQSATHSASFTGMITLPDGKPAFGAMVTVFNAEQTTRQTVYTASDGSYAIVTPYAGKLDVRARLANFSDVRTTVDSGADAVNSLNLQLKPFVTKEAASDALSASAHNARLNWANPADKATFVSQCNYCHQVGNATTRVPRSHEQWIATIRKMEGILAMVTRQEKETIADVLSKGFDGKPVAAQFWTVENGVALIHKLAHDERHMQASPGTLLSAALFQHVIDVDHVDRIDFGTGNDAYKAEWMEAVRPRYRLELFWPNHPANWPHIAIRHLRAYRAHK